MIYTELVKEASLISFEAHKEDFDKAGYPYFMHPFFLATQFDDEESVCVALLHDVIEDHGDRFPISYLQEKGFGNNILVALRLLTHEEGVPYMEYVARIKADSIARKVKLADLRHNSDLSRCGGIKPPKYELYQMAIAFLEKD